MGDYWRDDWPTSADGTEYDGKRLLDLVNQGRSPFASAWDVRKFLQEIEGHLNIEITDIPLVSSGSNHYGLEMKTSNGRTLVARLARADVNMPDYNDLPVTKLADELNFEAALYNSCQSEPTIRASRLLYSRVPVLNATLRLGIPEDTSGRSLFIFEKVPGHTNVWRELSAEDKVDLLNQLADIRAALFRFQLPPTLVRERLYNRIFAWMPPTSSVTPAPTRDFWMHVFAIKFKATIKNEGDMIGWPSDNETVRPKALAAKESLLRALPIILPEEQSGVSLYRFVLEHGDFGVHNITVDVDETKGRKPEATSLFDWERGSIVPAVLADPELAVSPVDLTVDESGEPMVTRRPEDMTQKDLATYQTWADTWIKKLYVKAPDLKNAIKAGKNVRHLWYALKGWRGGDAEVFFAALGAWADDLIIGQP